MDESVNGRLDLPSERDPNAPAWIRKMLPPNGLSFRDFVALALYDPRHGYYCSLEKGSRRGADYATSGMISPVFSYALSRLAREFLSLYGDDVCTIVDIGCGDGSLIAAIATELADVARARFVGIDQSLAHLRPEIRSRPDLLFSTSLDSIGASPALVLSNELFDALPFARLVQRASGLKELWVILQDGRLEWNERPAPESYSVYLASRSVQLEEGQFADISLDWADYYERIAGRIQAGLIVTFDYGFPTRKLFDVRVRRYGTAAAYSGHLVNRDLLARPGEQDLTAHINFDDLREAGERAGFETVCFVRQAPFLLSLGITEHSLFRPSHEIETIGSDDMLNLMDEREAARRLVLPDGIGEDISVLVQSRGSIYAPWSFTRSPLKY